MEGVAAQPTGVLSWTELRKMLADVHQARNRELFVWIKANSLVHVSFGRWASEGFGGEGLAH